MDLSDAKAEINDIEECESNTKCYTIYGIPHEGDYFECLDCYCQSTPINF